MGNRHSKGRKKHRKSRTSSGGSLESLILSANSLDLIYIDDYFDDARYLKLVEKRLAARRKQKNAGRVHRGRKTAKSDTVIMSRVGRKITPRSQVSSRVVPSSVRSPSKNPSNKSSTVNAIKPVITASSSKKTILVSRPATASRPKKKVASKSVTILSPTPPTSSTFHNSSFSTGDIPQHSSVSSDARSSSLGTNHEESSLYLQRSTQNPSRLGVTDEDTSRSSTKQVAEPNKKPRSILTSSQHPGTTSETVRRQRSYIVPSGTQKTFPQKSHSATAEWTPTTTVQTREKQMPTTKHQRPSYSDSLTSAQSSSVLSATRKPKKKLIVRGLKNFVDSHKRDSSLSMEHHKPFVARSSGGSGPAIWKREFPSKSKFHPDNFIYDWPEGPKAPIRPFSAMAKCKKHGGRCNDCGLFTCDLCQSCRKCETDCGCPCPSTGKVAGVNPLSPGEAYQEMFGGDGWNKACKVLCNLTEDDKRHPVGGNASKKKQKCNENWAKTNFYKSQIDVLNPYNIPLTDALPPVMMPHPPVQHPMCFPPMFSMPFMPMMTMPSPIMPYYSPQPPLPYPSYCDPCCPPPCPYPPSDSFMPTQNY